MSATISSSAPPGCSGMMVRPLYHGRGVGGPAVGVVLVLVRDRRGPRFFYHFAGGRGGHKRGFGFLCPDLWWIPLRHTKPCVVKVILP